MNSKFSLIIDFDSTIVSLETLECLAEIALSKKNNRDQIIKQISYYTKLAMNGEITFEKSLKYRFDLMDINHQHIKQVIKELKEKIDKTFIQNIDFFKKNKDDIYIVSGGFSSIIDEVLLANTNIKWNIFANNFIFNKDDLFSKKGFKGLQGEFFIEKNLSKQKLKIYKVSQNKFIKVY